MSYPIIMRAIRHFSGLVKEQCQDDTAAWEYVAHLNSALNAKTLEDAMEIVEDAIGDSIEWESFKE